MGVLAACVAPWKLSELASGSAGTTETRARNKTMIAAMLTQTAAAQLISSPRSSQQLVKRSLSSSTGLLLETSNETGELHTFLTNVDDISWDNTAEHLLGGQHAHQLLSLSGLPNANAKSQRFSYAISQIAALPPAVALGPVLNCKSQLDTLRFGMQFPKSHWPLSFSASQHFKSQSLQDANATKSQTLAFAAF